MSSHSEQTKLIMPKQHQSILSHLNQKDTKENPNPLQDNYYQINRQLEQQMAIDRAELIQYANQLAVKNSKLERANKELKSFAHTVSHDLQEPLRSVGMFSELLQLEYESSLDEQAQEYLSYIVGSVKRMDVLIRDLLSYSQVGKSEQTWVRTDLQQLTKEVIGDLQASIKATEATLKINSLPTVIVNPTEISQLLSNLISNSLKFRSQQKPVISVSSELRHDQWLITVTDNGIGIKPEYQEHIFEIFKRLHPQNHHPGSGIGLAICQKIVERHGGEIGVSSQYGEGASFYFTLPNRNFS